MIRPYDLAYIIIAVCLGLMLASVWHAPHWAIAVHGSVAVCVFLASYL